jgi:thiol-disulfide isomerase/thioredoxin
MVRNRITGLVVFGVVGLLVMTLSVTCRTGDSTTSKPEAAADITKDAGGPATVELLKEPQAVADFTLTALDGRRLSSADWKGKVVLLNFWATWCGPCRAEIPDLVALQSKYGDQLVVVGISEDEGPVDVVRKFAADYKVNYPVAMTTPEMQKIFPGITALPTTFILDRDGRMVQKHIGLLHPRETEAATRYLAGLTVDVEVKRVDDPSKMSAEDVAQVKDVPGVDLSKVPGERRAEVLQALNSENCTCGCGLTVAKCRIEDPNCTTSTPLAKAIVERTLAAR